MENHPTRWVEDFELRHKPGGETSGPDGVDALPTALQPGHASVRCIAPDEYVNELDAQTALEDPFGVEWIQFRAWLRRGRACREAEHNCQLPNQDQPSRAAHMAHLSRGPIRTPLGRRFEGAAIRSRDERSAYEKVSDHRSWPPGG